MEFQFDNDGAAIDRVLSASGQPFTEETFDDRLREGQEAAGAKRTLEGEAKRYVADWLYSFLAFVYAFGLAYLGTKEQSKNLLIAFGKRQIHRPGRKNNKWHSILRLLAGWFHPEGRMVEWGKKGKKVKQVEWLCDASLLKYAGTLAYMEKKGVKPADVVDYLRSNGGAIAVLTKYRAEYAEKRTKLINADDLKKAKELPAIAAGTLAEKPAEAGETDFFEAVCVWENGAFRIVQVLPESGGRARTRAIRLATNLHGQSEEVSDDEASEFFADHGVAA